MPDPELQKAIEVIQNRTASCQAGDRHLVVLDRGWIFGGNLAKVDGIFHLTDAFNVRKWGKGGFGALTQSRNAAEAVLDQCQPLKFDPSSVIFVVPISENWHE